MYACRWFPFSVKVFHKPRRVSSLFLINTAWAYCEPSPFRELSLLSAQGGFLLFCPLPLSLPVYFFSVTVTFLGEPVFCIFYLLIISFLSLLFSLMLIWSFWSVVIALFPIVSVDILISEVMLFDFRKPFFWCVLMLSS